MVKNEIKILIISALVSITFIFTFPHDLQGDEPQYDILSWNLKEGNGLSISTNSPFLPTMNREPIYPLFVSAIYFIFGHKLLPVQLIQVLVFILVCIIVFLFSKEVFGSRIAIYSLFLTAFCPTLLNYPAFLYSEILSAFLILLTGFSLTMAIKKQSLLWWCIAGVILGLASLIKAIMLPFFIFVLLCLIFLMKTDAHKIKLLLGFSFCFAIIVFPWLYRNYYYFNKLAVADRGGKVLWMRAQKINYSSEQICKHIIFTFSETVGNMLYPDPHREKTSSVYLSDSIISDRYILDLEEKGYSQSKINEILLDEALYKIKMHPIKYIVQTPLEFFKMLSFIHLPSLNSNEIIDRVENGNIFLKLLVFLFKSIMRFSAYIIFVMCLSGMYIKRKEWVNWIIPASILFYINLMYSLMFGDGRYAIVLIPYYFIFSAVSIEFVFRHKSIF